MLFILSMNTKQKGLLFFQKIQKLSKSRYCNRKCINQTRWFWLRIPTNISQICHTKIVCRPCVFYLQSHFSWEIREKNDPQWPLMFIHRMIYFSDLWNLRNLIKFNTWFNMHFYLFSISKDNFASSEDIQNLFHVM